MVLPPCDDVAGLEVDQEGAGEAQGVEAEMVVEAASSVATTAFTSQGEISLSSMKRAPSVPRRASTLPSAASTVMVGCSLCARSSRGSGSLGAKT